MGGYCTTRPVEISITQMQVVGTNDAGSDRVKGGGIEMCFFGKPEDLSICGGQQNSRNRRFMFFGCLKCCCVWLRGCNHPRL